MVGSTYIGYSDATLPITQVRVNTCFISKSITKNFCLITFQVNLNNKTFFKSLNKIIFLILCFIKWTLGV